VRELDGVDGIVTVLHFLESTPEDAWDQHFAQAEEQIAASGFGSLGVQAAFIPTNHGTNDYTDQLF
jgi:hypothetical protein